MKIIYHCYGGTHSSVTAAAIHLGWLPEDRVPDKEMLLQIPLYDRQNKWQHGYVFYLGRDREGHDVYITARRNKPEVLEAIFAGLANIFAVPAPSYCLVNAMSRVNWLIKLGGFLSRRLGFVRVGRPIVILGTRLAYPGLVELVKETKGTINAGDNKNSLLQQ